MTYKIRQVQLSDAEQILKVYTPFITDTCISFEYTADVGRIYKTD